MTSAILASKDTAIGVVPEWNPVNDEQRAFLEKHFNPTREEVGTIEEIESVASPDEAVVNAFLKEREFSIELEPLGEDEYGMASVLDYPWKWLEEGDEDCINYDKGVAAATLSAGISFFKTGAIFGGDDDRILVRIQTQTEDVIWMTMESAPAVDFDLVLQAQMLQAKAREDDSIKYDAVTFPMIDLDLETQVDWLIQMWGLNEHGQKATITQALQQTKLRMNEVGGRCQSAAAVAACLESCMVGPENPFIIDKPFLLWVERPSLSQPLFALHLCEDVWNKPEDLE